MKRFIAIACLSAAPFISGCDQDNSSARTFQTLVVDPIPVAKSLGRDELMQKQFNSALEQLNSQLQARAGELTAQVEKEKDKLGKSPSEEETEQFQKLVATASQSIKQTQLLARQKASDYREALLNEFNSELRAVAAEIAQARGATNVQVLNENVLWFEPAADITAEVIAKLRERANQNTSTPPANETTDKQELEKLEAVVDSIEKQEKTAP